MQTDLCRKLDIEFPIFAFTHCRDVVVAVSKAGGFGVLGAVGFSPEQLEVECKWIDEHVGDHSYGVDLVIPQRYEGMGELDPEKLEADLRAAIPVQHRHWMGLYAIAPSGLGIKHRTRARTETAVVEIVDPPIQTPQIREFLADWIGRGETGHVLQHGLKIALRTVQRRISKRSCNQGSVWVT